MPAIGLERDLHAHRVPDQHCPIDEGIVENARDVVREILDRHTRGITRRSGATMTSIMRMEPEAFADGVAQVAPDIPIATDPVAKQDRTLRPSLSPRLVEQRAAITRSDGVAPRGRHSCPV